MTFDAKTIAMLLEGIWDTLYMVIISPGVSYLLGIPLGIPLVVTDEDGIKPFPVFQKILGLIINLLRSVPFIILLLLMLPVTRMIVGTLIGSKAVIPPLVVSATPYIARMVESSFREVDAGVIEAAKSMGATTGQIVWKVLLPEAKPSLLVGAAISITTILGYTTMAGFVGGGGLGAIAINNGYYRYELGIMMVTVVLLIVIVQIIQEIFMRIAKATDRRSR